MYLLGVFNRISVVSRLFGIVFLICFFALSSSLFAATHYVDPELLAEQVVLTQAVLDDETNAEARFDLAMSYAYTGWIEIAWEQLKIVPRLEDNLEDKIVPQYEQLIRENPQEWRYYFKLAFGYFFQDEKEKALAMFEQARLIDPKNPWIIGFISLMHGEKKDYLAAKALAKEAIAIEPNGTALYFLLAEAYLKEGSYGKFLGASMKVLRLKSAESKYRPTPPPTPQRVLDEISAEEAAKEARKNAQWKARKLAEREEDDF